MPARPMFPLQYLIYHVDEDDNIIEHLAAVVNSSAAIAAFESLERSQSNCIIQLRQKTGIMRTTRVGRYDHVTGETEVIWRRQGGQRL